MKICVISSIFPPFSRGGAETAAYTAARIFTDAGDDVFVITCAPFEGWRSFAGKWEKIKMENGELRMENDHNSPQPPLNLRGGALRAIRVFRFTPLNLFSIF